MTGVTRGARQVVPAPREPVPDALSRAHLAAAFWQAPIGQAGSTLDGTLVAVNPAFAQILGYAGPGDMVGLDFQTLYRDGGQRGALCGPDSDLVRGRRDSAAADLVLLRPDGTTVSVAVRMAVHRDLRDRPVALLSWIWDIGGQFTALATLEHARAAEQLRQRFDSGSVAMCRLDADNRITSVNAAFAQLLPLPAAHVGALLPEIVVREDRLRLVRCLAASAVGAAGPPGTQLVEVRVGRPDGVLWCEVAVTAVEDGPDQVFTLVQVADVDARKQREADLARRAGYDELTRLPNRGALLVELASRLTVREKAEGLALLFVDINGFAALNTAVGPVAGDEVLVELARRLRQCVRHPDLVARLGDDRFVVVVGVEPGTAQRQVEGVTRRLLDAIEPVVPTSAGPCHVTVRVAVTHANAGEAPLVVVERGASVLDTPRTTPGRARRHSAGEPPTVTELLDSALDEGRLRVAYQPVVELATGTVVGAEALMRMRDRTGATVTPDVFIPVAESTGVIHTLGEWVLRQAVAQAVVWKRRRPAAKEFAIGVNLSPRQLDDPELLARVDAALAQSGLPPDALILELTEQLLTLEVDHVREVLAALRDRGIHLACDDFGTGFASIRSLAELPLDSIKIDRSWTARLTGSGAISRLAHGVLRLSTATGLTVIAEGVETLGERAALLAEGCELAQGYIFARPLTPEAFTSLLAKEVATGRPGTGPGAVW